MKATLLLVFVGIIAGSLLGRYVWAGYYGKRAAQLVIMSREVELAKSGQEAFFAYKSNSTQIAIYSLERHLTELSAGLKRFPEGLPDDRILVTLSRMDLQRASLVTHYRLVRLYRQCKDSTKANNHLQVTLAMPPRLAGARPSTSEMDEESVAKFVTKKDLAGEFW